MFSVIVRRITLWLARRLISKYHGLRDMHPYHPTCRHCATWQQFDALFFPYV